jgi:hypothetical protein
MNKWNNDTSAKHNNYKIHSPTCVQHRALHHHCEDGVGPTRRGVHVRLARGAVRFAALHDLVDF